MHNASKRVTARVVRSAQEGWVETPIPLAEAYQEYALATFNFKDNVAICVCACVRVR